MNKPIRILIVDDEDLIRRGVETILKRALETDIQTLLAEDGRQALELSAEYRPQIIITDIRMPNMDGLELIRTFQGMAVNPYFIILSGYEDFSYAKQAVQMGVKEYLTKPINKSDLIKSVQALIEHIGEESEQRAQQLNEKVLNQHLREEQTEGLMRRLLGNQESQVDVALDQLRDQGIQFNTSLYVCCVLHYVQVIDDEDLMRFYIKNLTSESFETITKQVYCFHLERQRLVCIFGGEDRLQLELMVSQCIQTASELLKQYLKTNPFTGIGNPVTSIRLIRQSFLEASKASLLKIFRPQSVLVQYAQLPDGPKEVDSPDIDQVVTTLQKLGVGRAVTMYDELLQGTPTLSLLRSTESVWNAVLDKIDDLIDQNPYLPAGPQPLTSLYDIWSLSAFKAGLLNNLQILDNYLRLIRENKTTNKLVFDVTAYLQSHLHQEINLNLVAAIFERNPSYLSTLFKKELQTSFSDYLTELRVRKSKKLLVESKKTIQQISQDVGYANPKHFSFVFHKLTGFSPSEYRERQGLLK